MSTAVVTASVGNYDHLGNHVYVNGVDYLFYTDRATTVLPDPNRWEILYLPESDHSNRLKAKLPKLNPHALPELSEYDHVIWIDGSMQIKSAGFVPAILSFLDRGLVLSPHFDGRDCGYGEATIRPKKYASEPLDEQIEFYESEGFPHHFGLWEAGVQARRMATPGLKEFGELWYQQNVRFSIQDQVSLGYSLWKTGFVPDILPKSWRDYDWIHLNAHTSED